MKTLCLCAFATLFLAISASGQVLHSGTEAALHRDPPLDGRISRFDITDATVRDALAELSSKKVDGLHLGFEEIIRDKIQDDPHVQGPHFSLHLEGATIREILNQICTSDVRYAWSQDGASMNIYPRATDNDPTYLLGLWIEQIVLSDIPDPDQALTPLARNFPAQQIGYAGIGLGGDKYEKPWTVVFEHLTVRRFINRIAEHMGPRTAWIWQGGTDARMFTFAKGGFHTQ